MTDQRYFFPPYEERIAPVVEQFGGERLNVYKGKDITPLRELSGGGLTSSYKVLYKAPKLEKIVFGVQCYREKLMTYTTSVWPDDRHALPIFSSFWAESVKGSYFVIDFFPTADCICDLDYLETYYGDLEDLYEEGVKRFPTRHTKDPDWFRALLSPYGITADVCPSTRVSQAHILDLMVGYLSEYVRLWRVDEPCSPEAMRLRLDRKQALRQCLRDHDPGGFMLEKAVGQALSDLTLEALF